MDKYERCKSCKYYLEHYVFVGMGFRPIGGHCINRALYKPRKRTNYELIENCEHWEKDTEEKEKQNESIKNLLLNINERLFTIEQILLLKENKHTPE
ncbi:MAG: hypothetical protein NC037_03300 [Bacteroides sp.]|nr:hypothetical protein [Bacillota bacterium]MCM1393387.1 hypothetical protein [[Eubacterium] siraeum]MCM1455535.1 hypothetical protein [Bacteroides sp.]